MKAFAIGTKNGNLLVEIVLLSGNKLFMFVSPTMIPLRISDQFEYEYARMNWGAKEKEIDPKPFAFLNTAEVNEAIQCLTRDLLIASTWIRHCDESAQHDGRTERWAEHIADRTVYESTVWQIEETKKLLFGLL